MYPTILLILVLLTAQSIPTVTVTTDRTWYAPGDQVQIIVHVSNGTLTGRVWFYIDKPDGRNLYFLWADVMCASATGFVFTLPQDAPEGTYTVTVTWDHQYAQTGFTVQSQPIPEFPFPLVVLLVAFTIATLALARRKTSARTQAPAPHP